MLCSIRAVTLGYNFSLFPGPLASFLAFPASNTVRQLLLRCFGADVPGSPPPSKNKRYFFNNGYHVQAIVAMVLAAIPSIPGYIESVILNRPDDTAW